MMMSLKEKRQIAPQRNKKRPRRPRSLLRLDGQLVCLRTACGHCVAWNVFELHDALNIMVRRAK